MSVEDFEKDSLWSERVTAAFLERELGPVKNWVYWLRNERKKPNPTIPDTRFPGHPAVFYALPDVEAYVERVRKESIDALGGSSHDHD